MRFDAVHGTTLFAVAFVGYCAGVAVAWAVVNLMHMGQPALLWIFPAILAPTLAVAAWQGLIGEMWEVGALDPATRNKTETNGEPEGDKREIERAVADKGQTVTRRITIATGAAE
jgi:minor histocompatibility antigen H13